MAAHEALPGAGSSDRRNVFSSRATLNRQRRMQRAEQRSFLVAPMLTVVRSVFSVLFPSECRLCSIPLTNISRLPVCPECLDSIEPIRVPQCVQCGERLLPAQLLRGDGRCQGCHEFEPQFDRAVSYAEYAGALRGLIHLLKYDRVLPAAPVLASMLAEAITQLDRDGSPAALLVPVPLHASKRGERGFNQAELIVRAAVKQLPRPLEIATVLKRRRPTHSQVGLTREERVANMRDAFSVTAPERVKGKTVILVDDVMTTGTTVAECARVLKKAGAERVWAATVARTLKSAALSGAVEYGEEEAHEAAEVAVSV
jgi:ComF family protein